MFGIEYKIIFCFPCEQVTSSRFTCVGGIVSRVKERSPNFQISFLFFVGFSSQHHHTSNHSFGFFFSLLKNVSWHDNFHGIINLMYSKYSKFLGRTNAIFEIVVTLWLYLENISVMWQKTMIMCPPSPFLVATFSHGHKLFCILST